MHEMVSAFVLIWDLIDFSLPGAAYMHQLLFLSWMAEDGLWSSNKFHYISLFRDK